MRALEHANHIRLGRSQLKKRVLSGEVAVADVISTKPVEAETMLVCDLLASQHRWGVKRSRQFLYSIRMSETRKIGELTPREQKILAQRLTPQTAVSEGPRLWENWRAA